MNAYEEKKQARIDRYLDSATKSEDTADSLHKESRRMMSVIPMGQPILVGHHSEGRDRRYREKAWNKLGKAVAASDKAEYYKDKAASAENNHAISSDDPDATLKLKEKIKTAEDAQALKKATNKIIRSKPKNEETPEKIAKLQAAGISETAAKAIFKPDCMGCIGFPSYNLTNNNANIRRMKERLVILERNSQRVTKTTTFESLNMEVVENVEENRIQFIFDGKPAEETRKILKGRGFKWAPSQEAWQRHLNGNGIYAARCVIKALKEALLEA